MVSNVWQLFQFSKECFFYPFLLFHHKVLKVFWNANNSLPYGALPEMYIHIEWSLQLGKAYPKGTFLGPDILWFEKAIEPFSSYPSHY